MYLYVWLFLFIFLLFIENLIFYFVKKMNILKIDYSDENSRNINLKEILFLKFRM